jgi:hypothetical protein
MKLNLSQYDNSASVKDMLERYRKLKTPIFSMFIWHSTSLNFTVWLTNVTLVKYGTNGYV